MHKRPRIERKTGATVIYRGKARPVVVALDLPAGLVTVRPHGCRKSKTYSLGDLFAWGPQLQLPLE